PRLHRRTVPPRPGGPRRGPVWSRWNTPCSCHGWATGPGPPLWLGPVGFKSRGQTGVEVQIHHLDGVEQPTGCPIPGQFDGVSDHACAAQEFGFGCTTRLQKRYEGGEEPAPSVGLPALEEAARGLLGQVVVQESTEG